MDYSPDDRTTADATIDPKTGAMTELHLLIDAAAYGDDGPYTVTYEVEDGLAEVISLPTVETPRRFHRVMRRADDIVSRIDAVTLVPWESAVGVPNDVEIQEVLAER